MGLNFSQKTKNKTTYPKATRLEKFVLRIEHLFSRWGDAIRFKYTKDAVVLCPECGKSLHQCGGDKSEIEYEKKYFGPVSIRVATGNVIRTCSCCNAKSLWSHVQSFVPGSLGTIDKGHAPKSKRTFISDVPDVPLHSLLRPEPLEGMRPSEHMKRHIRFRQHLPVDKRRMRKVKRALRYASIVSGNPDGRLDFTPVDLKYKR